MNKEEIINGVLCCKTTPNSEWRPLTPEQLTNKIVKLQKELAELKELENEQLRKGK
jgi:ribosomal protein L29